MLDLPASNTDIFPSRDTRVFSSTLNTLFARKGAFLHLRNYDLQEGFLSKVTQWSHINNVPDAAAATLEGFLWSGTCVSSTQLNRVNGVNTAYLHLETLLLQDVFLPKLTQSSEENNVLGAPAVNMCGFL